MLTSGVAGENRFSLNPMCNKSIAWSDIDWGKTQKIVSKVQNRIYKAARLGNKKRVHKLQKWLINSNAAKLMAVRTVTTLNKGRRSVGVDKLKVTTPQAKLQLALNLSLNGQAKPIRRVWISKPGKTELRPLGIPVIEDRAKQALAKLALEPEWEAVFEPNSYGFRPGRSAHDAIEAIFLNMHSDTPKWVYDADIRKCFDTIDHSALLKKLNTFPLMEKQISAWLKAGVMEGYANTGDSSEVLATEAGTPQGGIISPLLANVALHGLENHLLEFVSKLPMKPHPGANRGSVAKKKALGVVRYADDFILMHRNREILDLCVAESHKWLAMVGLIISEEKSAVRDCREGFQFLGFQIIQVRKLKSGKYKVKIHPSRNSQEKLLAKVKGILGKNKSANCFDLIMKLRPVIIGWANYFRYSECTKDFSTLTHKIFQKVRAWVFRRDARNGRRVVKEKYFPNGKCYQFDGEKHFDNWILNGKKKLKKGLVVEAYLPHMVWVKSKKHVKVLKDYSPYMGGMYWSIRSAKYSPYPLRVRTLLIRQKQQCNICKCKFTEFDTTSWEVDHILPRSQGGLDIYKNLQLVHKACHEAKTRSELSQKVPVQPLSNLQEPDEAKVSRPDLKTREGVNPNP